MDKLLQEINSARKNYYCEIITLINKTFNDNISEDILKFGYLRIIALNSIATIIKNSNRAEIFINEALNDKLNSYLLIMLGNTRTALMSERAFIEACLYFLFYIDHPVEFIQWKDQEYKLRVKNLFEYLHNHPITIKYNLKDYINNLQKEYSVLSLAVHGSSENFMMTTKNSFPNTFQNNHIEISKWNTRSNNTFLYISFILIAFNKHKFLRVSIR